MREMESHIRPPHKTLLAGTETEDQKLKLLISIKLEMERQNRRLFNYAHPADEYAVITTGTTTIQPDYDSPVKYESILYCLPLGTTSAILNIGSNRSIPLYSGTAIAVQQPIILTGLGILAVGDDRRTLIVAGATNNGYIGLMGHAFEREMNGK